MASIEDRVAVLERALGPLQELSGAIQGKPASALISIPHNDSWLFEDNVDGAGGFPGNLRYVISGNVQRVVSARLSIHLAAYRTYNNFVASGGTGNASNDHTHSHNHGSHAHSHNHGMQIAGGVAGNNLTINVGGPMIDPIGGPYVDATTMNADATATTPTTNAVGQSATHTHSISSSAALGVTEGAVATAVSVSFDGVDRTTALGGPFSSDVIELDVLKYLPMTKGVFHVMAMTPTGLGRIEAHLRLGVYVAAGSVF